MQAAVGQLHLRFRAYGRHDLPAGHPVGQVTQQGALAYPGLAAQDQDATRTREHVGDEVVERFAFVTTSDQPGHYLAP